MTPLTRALRWTLFATPLLLLLAAAPALAQAPAKPKAAAEEPTPIEKELETVRAMISNAEMKLRRGIVGVAPAEEGKKVVRTPAEMCCSENIKHIEEGLAKLREMVREVGTCFEQKWDRGGAEAVNMTVQELRALDTGIHAFAEAMEPEDTHGALAGSKRAYLNLKRRLDVLPACSTGVSAPTQ